MDRAIGYNEKSWGKEKMDIKLCFDANRKGMWEQNICSNTSTAKGARSVRVIKIGGEYKMIII